jgi:hypothetical protein
MRSITSLTAILFLLVTLAPRFATAYSMGDLVNWETGYVSGHAVNVDPWTGEGTGTFTFNPDDPSGLGIDYSTVASPGDPGTFYSEYERGESGSWGPGSFSASSAAGSLLFGVTIGTFEFDFVTLDLLGPITFSTTGSVPPLPGSLENLQFKARTDVSNIVWDQYGFEVISYDFAGPFLLTATYVPEPSVAMLLGMGLAGLAAIGRSRR